MKREIVFNPYKIIWTVELRKNNTIKFRHYPNVEKMRERFTAQKGSVVYVIRDINMKYVVNTYNGIEGETSVLSNKLVYRDNKFVQVIPMTSKQFNNPIYV